jgi:hypothetical protein
MQRAPHFALGLLFAFTLLAGCGQKSTKRDEPTPQQQTAAPAGSLSTLAIMGTDSAWYFFEGTVGEKTRICATIELSQDTLSGSYFYASQGKELRLDGRVQPNGSLWMKEYAPPSDVRRAENQAGNQTEEKFSGEFRGTLNRTQGLIQGQWTSADGKTTLPFMLQATAQYERSKHPTLDVAYSFPVFARPELKALNDTLARINRQFYDSSIASVSAMRKEMLDENAKQRTQGDTTSLNGTERIEALSETSTTDVHYASPSLVSLRTLSSSYSGGAHGMYGYGGMTFEIKNGLPVRVLLSDIFQVQNGSGYAEHLSSLVRKDLKRQGASFIDDAKPAEFTRRFTQAEGVNFTVRPFGLTFYFNPYDVGSYAEGAFEVRVPWSSLKKYLKPDGIARYFAQ